MIISPEPNGSVRRPCERIAVAAPRPMPGHSRKRPTRAPHGTSSHGLKQAVVSRAAPGLTHPVDKRLAIIRNALLEDRLREHKTQGRRCRGKGAPCVQIGFAEPQLTVKLDPTGSLLTSFIDLDKALARVPADESEYVGAPASQRMGATRHVRNCRRALASCAPRISIRGSPRSELGLALWKPSAIASSLTRFLPSSIRAPRPLKKSARESTRLVGPEQPTTADFRRSATKRRRATRCSGREPQVRRARSGRNARTEAVDDARR